MQTDPEIVASFLDEADERLEAIGNTLVEVESAGEISSENAGILQRTLHNLKGAARMVELPLFEKLVHLLEDLVKLVSQGKFPVNSMVQLLLEGVDDLKVGSIAMRQSGALRDAPEFETAITKLEIFLPDESDAPPVPYTSVPESAVARREVEQASQRSDPAPREASRVLVYDPARAEDLLEDFIVEADEMLEILQADCIALEENPTREVVDRIFRVAHTLKGSSGAIGLDALNLLTHKLEETLEEVKSGERKVDRALIDLLLIGLDESNRILVKVKTRRKFDHDIGPVFVRIEKAEAGETSADRSTPVQDVAVIPGEIPVSSPAVAGSGTLEPAAKTGAGIEVARSIRVDIGKLDAVINLVGELAIAKIRFDQRVTELENIRDDVGELLRNARTGSDSSRHLADLERIDTELLDFVDDQRHSCDDLQRISADLQKAVMVTRMVPVSQVLTKFKRLVRDISKAVNKPLNLVIEGESTEIDKTVAECIGDPLMHIIRNAADHGIEPPEIRRERGKPEEGTIRIEAGYQGDLVVIRISDDGGGLNKEKILKKAVEKGLVSANEAEQMEPPAIFDLIFQPGFSTAANVTDISGRGVGMDVVRNSINKLKGMVVVQSEDGKGSTLTIKLPLTLAIIQALIVKVGEQRLALPLAAVQESIFIPEEEIHLIGNKEVFNLRGEAISLVMLADVLGLAERQRSASQERSVVVATTGTEYIGLEVDAFEGKQEVVIKSLGSVLKNVRFASGTTIMGDGSLALIVDLPEVVNATKDREVGVRMRSRSEAAESETDSRSGQADDKPGASAAPGGEEPAAGTGAKLPTAAKRGTILLVDDSPTVLKILSGGLENHGMKVVTANDGVEACEYLEKHDDVDAVITDITMPNMDGYQLCEKIRNHPRLQNMPVMMISARGEKLDKIRGFEAGADEYFTKPFDPELVIHRIEGILKIPRASA